MAKKTKTESVILPRPVSIISPVLEVREAYRNIYEGQLTNAFTTVNSKKTPHIDVYKEKQAWLFDISELGGGEVTLTEPDKNSLSMSSSQLLDMIALKLTEVLPYGGSDEDLGKYLDCVLSIDDYMRYRELTDREDAIKQLKKDMRTLFNASTIATITYYPGTRSNRVKVTEKLEVRYVDAIPKGRITSHAHFRIALSYAKYLTHSQVMPYPLKILSSQKNKNFYYIGKKLAAHYNMNRKKRNAESISLDAVLMYTPEIPTFDEEYNRGRHYRQRIIDPVVKTLDEMVEKSLLCEWTLWHGKNKPLSDEELNSWVFGKNSGKELYIHFKFNQYPSKNKEDKINNPDFILIESDESTKKRSS